ncbi:MAG TPA: ATP-binding cassette domain-containing protein [Patescibacteria group bacterium]|nr:ATP-binding cassette domain-containing protein [Patescibacteria group bacterium]
MSSIISVNNICKQYTTFKRGSTFAEMIKSLLVRDKVIIDAVKDISFEIEQGTITGLLGKNGAGKSTLIKMMTGVLFPSSGEINVLGYIPYKQRAKYVTQISAVFGQKSQLIWDIPPIDSFEMNKAIYNISNEDYKTNLSRMVDIFEVSEIIKRPTRSLSLGERMKCEFIMAMLHGPKIVFLDEPTIGLDIISKEHVREFILDMNKSGTTFILTTHDIGDIEKLAERIIIINEGMKVYDDSIGSLKKYLGNKKTVQIQMKMPIGEINLNGVSVLNRQSDYEAELLLDNSIIDINSFVSSISNFGEIADISIKTLGVEEIIKAIYNKPLLSVEA